MREKSRGGGGRGGKRHGLKRAREKKIRSVSNGRRALLRFASPRSAVFRVLLPRPLLFFLPPFASCFFLPFLSLSLSLSSFLSSYCSRTKVGKTFGVFFSPGQPTISAVRASDNETDRPSLIGPFRPIKSEFFRARRKRRGNGPESDFGRS